MTHTAELIAVGTELLLGNIANTDAQILSQGLSTLGITVHYHTVVGDNPQRLRQALDIARTRADIIITTGGLGPTYDDLTKQTICAAFGRELELHPDILEGIRSFFAKTGRTMPENNVQQAMLPVGCTVFDNPVGTAPGCAFEEGGVHVLMLPGPPFECRYMFENRAVPYLQALTDGVIVSQSILAGQALCKVGDTVQAGQRLVSGIVDLDWTYAVENAKAEIYAYTHRTGTVVTPDSGYIKEATGETVRCLWLEVGKRRIKIFGNSGILEASCDKMWERQPLTLPGGYELPVALIWETYTPYTLRAASSTESAAQLLLADYAESMTRAGMVAGEILERDLDLTVRRGIYRLDWDFRCREMIARSVEFDFSEKDFDP